MHMYIYICFKYKKRFILRNWLMQSWRLRSLTVSCLQAGVPGEQMV